MDEDPLKDDLIGRAPPIAYSTLMKSGSVD